MGPKKSGKWDIENIRDLGNMGQNNTFVTIIIQKFSREQARGTYLLLILLKFDS